MGLRDTFNEIFSKAVKSTLRKDGKEPDSSLPAQAVYRAFNSSPSLMVISNISNGKIIDVNETFLTALGYSKKLVVGKTFEEIRLFPDIEESNKYIRLLPRLRKVTDFPVKLKDRKDNILQCFFSAQSIEIEGERYLLSTFNPDINSATMSLNERTEDILDDIFDTVSSYLIRVRITDNDEFLIKEINRKAEEVENIPASSLKGKILSSTPLSQKIKLVELLNHIRITGEPYKLAVSPLGNRSEGFYIGLLLSSGDIVITWEPPETSGSFELKDFRQTAWQSDEVSEMTFEIDLKGRLTKADRRSLLFLGYTMNDLEKGLYITDLFPAEELDRAMKNLRRIRNENDTISNEYISRRKDGSTFPILTRTFGIFTNGQLTGYRGVVTDLTKLKNRELQIAREKAFLEHLIDSTPLAIVITDIPGKITHVNREFTNLFGYSNEEALGKYINDLVVPEEFAEEAEQVDNRVVSLEKVFLETIRKDKQGKRIDVSLLASGIVINDVLIATLCIYRNITAERRNKLLQEILYNISSATLEFSDIKDIYQIIVKEISKIWDTDNFFIALYNKDSHTLSLPFFSDEKDDFREIPVKGTITGWVINNIKSVLLKENDIIEMEKKGEVDLVGTPCKVWMGVPLKANDEIIGAMCLQDYSDTNKFSNDDLSLLELIANQIAVSIQKRKMLDNLVIERKKAEDAANSKQSFMSTMSHEIRTPLNEVIGISNLLLQTNPNPDQLDLIKTLRFSANHLMSLVNDVLDYSKMESGKITFEQVQFNLNDFLKEIERSYTFRAIEKNINFTIYKSPGVPEEITGDQIRLNQVLSNLLSNAFKFTNNGSISIRVSELQRKGNRTTLEFRVTDTGIGIPQDKQQYLFESFTQASSDTTRRFGGTGLGLSICKKLIELQGGKISLESEPDKGSTFIFSLTFGITAGKTGEADKIPAIQSFEGLKGRRILVAEDNKINFFVVNKFLTGWGIKVTHAENGKDALEKLEAEEFDLILMDLHMPVMDGIEATRIIRNMQNPAIRDIPIIALTAAIMSETNDRIEGLSINDYILKPFKPEDLFSKIKKYIR